MLCRERSGAVNRPERSVFATAADRPVCISPDFSGIVAEETTAAGIVARMVERYPDWGNLHTLWHSAKTAVERQGP